MKVCYPFGKKEVNVKARDDASFLLTNKSGGFVFLGAKKNVSKFQGVFFQENWNYYKVIEDIRLISTETTEIRNNLKNIERLSGSAVERFITNHTDSLLYEVEDFNGYLSLSLDCREIYDFNDQGRVYNIYHEEDCLIIEYTKDSTVKDERYKVFLAIMGINEYFKVEDWVQKYYSFDHKRSSYPINLYAYDAIKIKINNNARLVFSYATEKDKAIKAARHSMENFNYLKKSKENYVNTLIKTSIQAPDDILAAYKASILAMDSFLVENMGKRGIIAGYPWFTQIWSRDEAICLGSLIADEKYNEVKKIIHRQLEKILPDGRIQNRFPGSLLGSADGVGWIFVRLYDFLKILKNKGLIDEYYTKKDILKLRKTLAKSIRLLLKHHNRQGLATNNPKETWMDTEYKDDVRTGERIEIQALRLCMYKLMILITELTEDEIKNQIYSKLLQVTYDRVKQKFWKKPLLYDGNNDPTIRPNIFIAYYVYPDFLTKSEWKACFDNALKALWLSFGGIATIDKNHKYFVDTYSGQDNRSYHRGDSWFFINNMAAICMHRLDKKRYSDKIHKIIQASTSEILKGGILGYHAELTSAKGLSSEASLAQAWSSAMYAELILEVY